MLSECVFFIVTNARKHQYEFQVNYEFLTIDFQVL